MLPIDDHLIAVWTLENRERFNKEGIKLLRFLDKPKVDQSLILGINVEVFDRDINDRKIVVFSKLFRTPEMPSAMKPATRDRTFITAASGRVSLAMDILRSVFVVPSDV